jgi:hypothetical protein
MSYLLHCIVEQNADEPPPERRVRMVAADGLAAVVSCVEDAGAAPGVASLLAYEKVVEAIHARMPVVPLRYGCLMESESGIVRLLEDRCQEYKALLSRFRGMTEMAIRVLCPACEGSLPSSSLPPGAAYLAALRNRYSCGDSLAPEETRLADRIAGALSGCYAEQRREASPAERKRLVSLYFLTPRSCVERFRDQSRRIRLPGGVKWLLSGPWPPYNFAAFAG